MERKKFSLKKFLIVLMFLSFLLTLFTSVMSFTKSYSSDIALLHVSAGLCFITLSIWHIIKSRKALKSYFTNMNRLHITKEVIVSLFIIAIVTTGSVLKLWPFALVENFLKNESNTSDRKIVTQENIAGKKLEIEFREGENYLSQKFRFMRKVTISPQIAVWAEDEQGNYIDTLYVTQKAGKSDWIGLPFETVQRPTSLPLWFHRRGDKSGDRLDMPTQNNPLPDTVSSATPSGNFTLSTKINNKFDRIILYAEVNKSFDYNTYYSEQKLESGKKGHLEMSYSGQPSVVFSTKLDLSSPQKLYKMDIVGHSDPTGENGKLYTDLEGLDSALKIIDRILVEIQ